MAKEKNSKENKNTKKENNKNFFKEFKAELKRVSWPTFKQLVNNTGIVLAIVIIVAAIVFVLDVIFENLNNFGVERLKALVTSSSSETVESEEEHDHDHEGEENVVAEEGTVDAENVVTEANTTNTVTEGTTNGVTDNTVVTQEETTNTVESSVEGNN